MRFGMDWWRVELRLACACLFGALVSGMPVQAIPSTEISDAELIAKAPTIQFQSWTTARWSARPIELDRRAFIANQLTALGYPPGFVRLYQMEVDVEQDSVVYWLPMQPESRGC